MGFLSLASFYPLDHTCITKPLHLAFIVTLLVKPRKKNWFFPLNSFPKGMPK